MAKRHKKTPEEIAAETILSEERRIQEAMRSAFIEATRAGVPSWYHAVGDQVYYGNNFVTIAEIYNNGLCYKVKMQERKKDSQDTKLVENILPWFKLRKREAGTSAIWHSNSCTPALFLTAKPSKHGRASTSCSAWIPTTAAW